jgi:hypothetical protein
VTRSPLAYPLNRAADTDVGGAADLQTDIMRFMAILSLCLVAIFALVQSIPLAPVEPAPEEPVAAGGPSGPKEVAFEADAAPTPVDAPAPAEPPPVEKPVVLTRPKWIPKYTPALPAETVLEPAAGPVTEPITEPVAEAPVEQPPPAESGEEGFTLRFASNAALTRAVAAHHVGLYAISAGTAKRMTVSESRISFWDASTPNAFHEMEANTVPAPVVQALARAGIETTSVNWGVTLPGKMTRQVETLMQEHSGGSLIIAASGDIHWEAPQ